jgi:hypothetical protein
MNAPYASIQPEHVTLSYETKGKLYQVRALRDGQVMYGINGSLVESLPNTSGTKALLGKYWPNADLIGEYLTRPTNEGFWQLKRVLEGDVQRAGGKRRHAVAGSPTCRCGHTRPSHRPRCTKPGCFCYGFETAPTCARCGETTEYCRCPGGTVERAAGKRRHHAAGTRVQVLGRSRKGDSTFAGQYGTIHSVGRVMGKGPAYRVTLDSGTQVDQISPKMVKLAAELKGMLRR